MDGFTERKREREQYRGDLGMKLVKERQNYVKKKQEMVYFQEKEENMEVFQ